MNALEKKLGYKFENPQLLRRALTHSSYANEKKTGASYERLEFLGDAVLGMVAADFLFRHHSAYAEGDLTRTRASLVCEGSLHQVALTLDLGAHMLLGKGEEQGGGRARASILADGVEAVFAAVYLDGGLEAVRPIITRLILERGQVDAVGLDYKTALQELVQRTPGQKLEYMLESVSGPDHAKRFNVAVQLECEMIGRGSGKSKKEAEQLAAKEALGKIKG